MKEADGYTNCKKKDTMEFSIKRAKSSGSMPEWLMGADCKSAGNAYAGSNPARPKQRVVLNRFLRRGVRVVYGLGLENQRNVSYRGFESHPLRYTKKVRPI